MIGVFWACHWLTHISTLTRSKPDVQGRTMDTKLPEPWTPWRTPSPLQGRRPTKAELAEAAANGITLDDVLPTRRS